MADQKYNSIRDGFGEGLLALGTSNDKVVGLSGDLSESVRMAEFAKKYPNRYFEVGIAEQNMAGIGAGLGLSGYIPFLGTFASFQPMRNLDQIRTSICLMDANVKLISSHAGFSHAADGVQIQALEDVSIMRTLPNMRVLVPADAEQAAQMTHWAAEIDGPVYLRLGRSATPYLSAHGLVDQDFFSVPEFGKAQVLRSGSDGTIFACGYMVELALQAADQLKRDGVYVAVMNIHTIKPFDTRTVLEAADATRNIVTVEEHQLTGGLGSAVAEALAQSDIDSRLAMVGIDDQFGETAENSSQLWDKYGLTVSNIVSSLKRLLD